MGYKLIKYNKFKYYFTASGQLKVQIYSNRYEFVKNSVSAQREAYYTLVFNDFKKEHLYLKNNTNTYLTPSQYYSLQDFTYERDNTKNNQINKMRATLAYKKGLFNILPCTNKTHFQYGTFKESLNSIESRYHKDRERLEAKAKTKKLNTFYDYAFANKWDTFITLTYASSKRYKYQNNDILNMRQRTGKFPYLGVVEHHKKGDIHIHLLANIEQVAVVGKTHKEKNNFFATNYWKKGFVRLDKIKDYDKTIHYMSKYLTKNNVGSILKSNGLLKPKKITGDMTCNIDTKNIQFSKKTKRGIYITAKNIFEKNKVLNQLTGEIIID